MFKLHAARALAPVLIALIMCTNSSFVFAADDKTWYQIEVIIAQRADATANLENFDLQPAAAKWPAGRRLSSFDPQNGNRNLLENTEFIDLPVDQKMLNAEARRLSGKGELQVLNHHSWRQILDADKRINWIDIKGGYAWGGHQQLEGSLGFSKGRYLHIHSNIHLNQFPSVTSSSDLTKHSLLSAGQSLIPVIETRFSLIQRRKMRSNELHYLDHPKLILLVKIIPFAPAEPIVEADLEPTTVLVDLTKPTLAE
jgi:hypothetical protein